MAKDNKRLTRENVQEFIKKSDETGIIEGEKPSSSKRKRGGFGATLASGGATLAGKLTRGANTLGGTLAEGLKSEIDHSDFKVRLKAFGLGLAVTCAILAALMLVPGASQMEAIPYDLKLRHRFIDMKESGSIVHIDLDDQTIASVGRWPWPRIKWAGFVRAAKEAGVRHLAFDVEFYQNQQEEVDPAAFSEFRKWGTLDLPDKVDRSVRTWDGALRIATDQLEDALKKLSEAETEEARSVARTAYQIALRDVKSVRTLIAASDVDQQLLSEFDRLSASVVVDHDELFAAEVRAAGNVVLPLHFDRPALTVAQDGRPAVTKALYEKVEAFFDEVGARDLNRISRDDIATAVVGFTVRDGVRDRDVLIDEKIAAQYAEQAFTNIRMLYLYRMVAKWYAALPEERIRADMAAYLENWTDFVAKQFAEGQVFARLSGGFEANGFSNDWVKQAAEQLQRHYCWYRLRHGSAEVVRAADGTVTLGDRKPGWCYPTSVIEGYDPKRWDPWQERMGSDDHAEDSLLHFRDTGFVPAIFRLFDAAYSTGFVSIEKDFDGTVRGVPLVVVYEETYSGERVVVPQIALKVLFHEIGADLSSLKVVPGVHLSFMAVRKLVEALREDKHLPNDEWAKLVALSGVESEMAEYRVVIDERGIMRINWTGGDNTQFPDIFSHMPVSWLIDAADKDAENRGNRTRFERTLSSPELQFTDDMTYASLGGAGTSMRVHYEMPPFRLSSAMFNILKEVPVTKRNMIRDWVVGRLARAVNERVERARSADWVEQWDAVLKTAEGEQEAAKKAFEDGWKEANELQLVAFLRDFAGEVKRVFGVAPETADAQLLDELLEAGVPPSAATPIATSLQGLSALAPGKLPRLAGLPAAAAADFRAPLGALVDRGLLSCSRLSPTDRMKVQWLLIDAMGALTLPGARFDEALAEIDAVVKAAYGAVPSDLPEEYAAERKFFLRELPAKIANNGKAFRRLMFERGMPVSNEAVAAVRENPDALSAAMVVRRLAFEIPVMAAAGMLSSEHPLVVALGSVPAAALDQSDEGMGPLHEALIALKSDILGFSDPHAATIARRVNYHYTRFKAAEDRFTAAHAKSLANASGIVNARFGLVGWAATGQGDVLVTPNNKSIPGPALHTNTFNTVLQSMEPVPVPGITIIIAIALGSMVSLMTARFSVKWAIGTAVAVLASYWVIDSFVFSATSSSILTVAATLPWMGSFLSIQVYRYAVEYRAKLKIKGQFGKFLSQEAVEELQKNPDMLKLGGDERELCVLFSDIAGFTPISESMSAPRLIDFLNDYMGRMCVSIKESKGYVDKFIGDAIMAIWGAPVPVPDYSARAVKTAVRNTQSLAAWNRERAERGELEVGARIGLATGPMVAGNMGTEWKLNYTCIGDTVNLGARLEAANKQYGTQIMINLMCYEQAKDVIVGHILDNIAVKGKKKGVPVFTVIGLVGETEQRYVKGAEIYGRGFELYQKEKWAEALPLFKEAKELLPPPYQVKEGPADIMIERCETLLTATREERMEILHLKTVDDEWDGVWKLTSK